MIRPLAERCWSHDWRFPGPNMLDPGICAKCHREGIQWYDFLSGGVSVRRRGTPTTDLRLVYRV